MRDQLTVAVSTCGSRVLSLKQEDLPQVDGVRWLIIGQIAGAPADEAARIITHLNGLSAREDIDILRRPGERGVANSRLAALRETRTELLIFADDDMEFDPRGWRDLLEFFAGNPRISFACARLRAPEGHWRKPYGAERVRQVTRFNSLKVGTPELVVRMPDIRRAGVTYDTGFGLNTPNPVGDEYVFVTDCLKSGLKGAHVPFCVGVHPGESSGKTFDAQALRARASLFNRVFGPWGVGMRLAFAVRHRHHVGSKRLLLTFVLTPGRLAGC